MRADRRARARAAAILALVCALWIVPMVVLFSASISSNDAVLREGYGFLPRQVDFSAYEYLFSKSGAIVHALGVSFAVMAAGTAASTLLAAFLAYPLSRPGLRGRTLVLGLILFTMLFNGGLVPTYMIYTQVIDLRDSFAALIVPNLLLSGFQVILMRTYFMNSIPASILEAAEIDGASPMRVFFQVVLPLSLPIFATVGFLQASVYWNDWFNAMLYINDADLMGLQAVMNQMLTNLNFLSSLSQNAISGALGGAAASPPTATIRMAMAVLGILPSLILFPIAQKYLVQGLTLGGTKE
ncbi:MAG: carbohydrate ABC transporter permease [Oscillospiraceae bacterium]|nr:carbohydrate ABC transporter permease [Oscillospiraceae bacterium]